MSHCGLCGRYINDAFPGEWSVCDACAGVEGAPFGSGGDLGA